MEFLVDHDDLENPLFELLCAESVNTKNMRRNSKHSTNTGENPGVSVLRTLMDQYGLKAADLANELGSKSNVSNILNGRRALTVNHIKALTQRFKLPADAFIE